MARVMNSVKVLLLIWAISGVAAANPSMPCPALQITAACGAKGAEISLKLGADVPAGVSFLITAQSEGQISEKAAQSLAAGGELLLHPLGAAGSQLTLAVLGLEGLGADTPCCFSNQRLHVPDCAVENVPENTLENIAPALEAPTDLAIDLILAEACQRPNAVAICQGSLTLKASNSQFGDAVQITLSSVLAKSLHGDGVICSDFIGDQSLCRVALTGLTSNYDFALKTTANPPEVRLCAGLGIDPGVQALALQAALRDAGYDVGAVDGQVGAKTLEALQRFLTDAGLPSADGVLSPEALAALGLADFSDADAANNQSCATATIPPPPLVCDARTARLDGGECLCKFKGMDAVSTTACACPKGMILGKNGCIEPITDPVSDAVTAPDTPLRCDALTTVLRNGACACRYETMAQISKTACLCESGLPPLPGLGCDIPQIKLDVPIVPEAPSGDPSEAVIETPVEPKAP